MDKKIRYGLVGFGAQGGAYAKILTGTSMYPGFPAAPIPLTAHWAPSATSTRLSVRL